MEKIEKIEKFFKEHDYPKPTRIAPIGTWKSGEMFGVECGSFFIKRYCVYFLNGEVHHIREN